MPRRNVRGQAIAASLGALLLTAASLGGTTPMASATAIKYGTVTFKGYMSGKVSIPAPSGGGKAGCWEGRQLLGTSDVGLVTIALGSTTLSVGGKRQHLARLTVGFVVINFGNTEQISLTGGKTVATATVDYSTSKPYGVQAEGYSGHITTSQKGTSGSTSTTYIQEINYQPVVKDSTTVSASWANCHPIAPSPT